MDASEPQSEFATSVVRRLRENGEIAYWAGGCVRDLLRSKKPGDYDVATSAPPERVRKLFGQKRTLAVGESFGVIIVLPPEGLQPVEVATFRTEGPYADGRRPDSVRFSTPEEDAQRRDFTINGMFYDPIEKQVLDYVGGQADLASRIVRAIGDPRARMREDKLRLLRAVRFAAVLNFSLDTATAEAVREMSSELGVVSVERIAQELRKMLVHAHRARAVELCRDLGLMEVIFPGWSAIEGQGADTLQLLAALVEPSFPLALAVLLRRVPNPSGGGRKEVIDGATVRGHCRRLKLSTAEMDACVWLHAHQNDLADIERSDDASLKRLLAHPLSDSLRQWFDVQALFDSKAAKAVQLLNERTARWTEADINPPPFLTGDDLIPLGLKPGPRIKEILDTIRTAQLNGQLVDRDAALVMARAASR